ncbi:MAG: penicillin-binding protein 2 [Candidatus Omnitrophica bacterium]|nr:penicillin-binding protein 2 [Candidatus Omnitrophota bacterium]
MRIKVFVRILFLALVFVIAGLFNIQIIGHEAFRKMSEGNRLRVIPFKAPRGGIFDNKGRPLAQDVICFNAAIVYNQMSDRKLLAEKLSRVLEVPLETVEERIKNCRGKGYLTQPVVDDVGIKGATLIEEMLSDHPGLMVDVATKREYPGGEASSGVIGFLGLINSAELGRMKPYGYTIDDLIGRSGLEKQYDTYLRGEDGGKQVEVDHRGREIRMLGFLEPVPGKNITTTIDLDLENYCYSLIKGRKGAIVALDPRDGAVKAIVTSPAFDPAVFIDKKRKKEVTPLLKNDDRPMVMRAISGIYPPGSVFKVVVALAAMERGKIKPSTEFTCNGFLDLGSIKFGCWKKDGHGVQNVILALENSCDVFFYRTGLASGVNNIIEYAEKFGIGRSTGIDLPAENPGLLPTPEWKKKRFKQKWFDGDTVNYSIGQGYLLASPLQMAKVISVFANKGYLVNPYLTAKIGDVTIENPQRDHMNISEYAIDTIRKGLYDCVNDPGGTGGKAYNKDFVVAGKTGTSQTSKAENHGWFAGFAPYDDAKLAVVVFDEYGGAGGQFAAQAAGKVFMKAKELGLL